MLRYLENVVTLRLDTEACNGCGMCSIVCPHEVFIMKNQKANIADQNACIECGACAINCPENAIQVKTGAGCAAGILLQAIGKNNECSCGCGVSPAVTESNQTNCCGTQNKDLKTENDMTSCNTETENKKNDNGSSCCRC